MPTHGSSSPEREIPKFPYQACIQPWVLARAGGCFNPDWHGLPAISALAGRCCSLASQAQSTPCLDSLLYATGCCGLAQPSLPLDSAHTSREEFCSLALHLALALVLRSGRCSLTWELFKFPQQARFQPVFTWATGCLALLGMICPHSWPFLVPETCLAQPGTLPTPVSMSIR